MLGRPAKGTEEADLARVDMEGVGQAGRRTLRGANNQSEAAEEALRSDPLGRGRARGRGEQVAPQVRWWADGV